MTTKEIAEAVGKAEKTVRTWAARASAKSAEASAKLAEAQKSGGRPADWTLDEAVAIIEQGMGKNAAGLYRENAKRSVVPAQVSSLTARDMEVIGGIVAAVMANLTERMGSIEARIEQRQALLPAPQIKPRDNITRIVREYAHLKGIEYGHAWGELYREYGYRTNSNPRRAAENRKMPIIDYIDAEGMMGTLEAVAIDWAQ